MAKEFNNDLKWVTLNGKIFLVTVKGKEITGIAVKNPDLPAASHFRDYFKQKATGRLVTISIGEGKDIFTQELSDAQKIDFAMVTAQWAAAASMSEGWVTCKVFEEVFEQKAPF
jgi:hypothetical protein